METELTVIEARDLIKSSETNTLQLLDVRTRSVFENESLPGFINIPVNELSRKIDQLDGKRRTLLLCKDGSQSQQAMKLLESCGFNVQVIRGGLDDWKKIIETPLAEEV